MQTWRAGFLAIFFVIFASGARAQDPAKIFDFIQNQIQNQAARQQQRQNERQQQQQSQQLYNEFVGAWRDCFDERILPRCDEALQFPNMAADDRQHLLEQRAELTAEVQAQQDQEERERQSQIEAANEQRRLQFERDQAAAQQRQQEIDAQSAKAEQAQQAVEAEEKQAAELRALVSASYACQRYEVEGCDQVIASQYSGRPEFASIVAWRTAALTFRTDMSACQTGIVEACDRASTSPAAFATDRNSIAEWRTAASPVNRALATFQAIPAMIGVSPLVLRIIIGGATVLGLALAMMMFRRIGDAAKPVAFVTATMAATPPSLPAVLPVPVTGDRPCDTEIAVDAVELSNAGLGESHDNTRRLPDPTPQPKPNALVPVTDADALTVRDTPTALRALRLAHAYFDEACRDDLSIVDGQRAARTTLSLASRQLEIAFRADPNARLELDGDRRLAQEQLRARVLCQEALTWRFDKLGRACTLAERACEADPTDPASFQLLGSFHFDNRNRAKAIAALTRAYELDPDNIETCKLLDRAQNMGDAEIVTYKATRAGVEHLQYGSTDVEHFRHDI